MYDKSTLIKAFSEVHVVGKLREILLKNLDSLPLTDLYLTHPVLKSKIYGSSFKPVILEFLKKHDIEEICSLVNSAALTVITYIIMGEKPNLVHEVLEWIRKQRLDDGGWHWKSKKEKPEKSEAWSTALVLASFQIARVQIDYDTIIEFLKKNWESNRWNGFPEITLIYLSYAGHNKNDKLLQKPVEYLLETQLKNGAWPGYSLKTVKGGIFRTCVILNALTSLGFTIDDEVILKGLNYVETKLQKILNAKWGGILVQALGGLASTLLILGMEK